MILIFKTNDLLRGIESSLGTKRSMASFIQVQSTYDLFTHVKLIHSDVAKLHWGVEGEKSDRGRFKCRKMEDWSLEPMEPIQDIMLWGNLQCYTRTIGYFYPGFLVPLLVATWVCADATRWRIPSTKVRVPWRPTKLGVFSSQAKQAELFELFRIVHRVAKAWRRTDNY